MFDSKGTAINNSSMARILDIPSDAEYPDLANEVRRLLGWVQPNSGVFYTTRDAGNLTKVSCTTVANLASGRRTKYHTLVAFAKKMPGADVHKLLDLAGYQLKEEDKPAETQQAPGLRILTQLGFDLNLMTPDEIDDLSHCLDTAAMEWVQKRS